MLKPFTPDEILSAVASPSGNVKNTDVLDKTPKEIFDSEGADIQTAARAAVLIMTGAEKESDRLRAAELVLKVQGVYTPDKSAVPAGITINILSQAGVTQVNLGNLIVPAN